MNVLKRPMFFAAAICSIVAAISLFSLLVALLILVLSIIMLLIVVLKKNYKYILVLFAVLLFALNLVFQFVKISRINTFDGRKLVGKFTVIEDVVDHGEYCSITLKESSCKKLPNGVKLLVFDYDKTNLKTGDIVEVTITLSAVQKHDKYRLSDYSDSIYATANIESIKILKDKSWYYRTTEKIRDFVRKKVSANFEGDVAGLLVALTTGDKTMLSDKFLGNVKTTGISHVIVVSGMHLAIIMSAVYLCIDRLFYNKYIRCVLSIILVVTIYSICGFTMSITRAGAMFVVVSLAPIFNRENDSLSSLLTAITAVLIATPFAIANISFLLSVLSTLAIIWIVPFYYRLITEKLNLSSKFFKSILATILCSVFAIIFTLPVTIKVFGYVSIVAPVTNLIVNLPVTVGLLFNITATILSVIPVMKFISYPLFWIAGICSKFTAFTVNLIAKLPITVAVLPKSTFFWSLLVALLVIGYMYFYEFKKKKE